MSAKLRLYDSLGRIERPFTSIRPEQVGIYVCGPTVQAAPHIGHLRSMVVFDVLRRWLIWSGYTVTFVRNVTDIDDKIIHNAGHEGMTWWALAQKYEQEFAKADETIGNLAPTYQPRAAGNIPEIIELIERLVASGVAYPKAGSVWFSVEKCPDYGVLSGQQTQSMLASPEQEPGKASPHDFALWKAAKPDEPAWPSPWGRGRPGWHIECSAMALAYLGEHFDIHGGGRDLLFPHHENERAQSTCAGHDFANFWVHNAWVTTAGEKMSKSLSNSLRVNQVLKDVRPIELRHYFISAHYRSNLEYSPAALQESATSFRRVIAFLKRAGVSGPAQVSVSTSKVQDESEVVLVNLIPAFIEAMNDDCATPQALAVIHDLVSKGNIALAEGQTQAALVLACQAQAGLAVLGCDPFEINWLKNFDENDHLISALKSLVGELIIERNKARESGDYAVADRIRDSLAAAGVVVEDSQGETGWSLRDER